MDLENFGYNGSMSSTTLVDVFDQIIGGEDIPKISFLLQRLSPEQAALQLKGFPNSILTVLAHADLWQVIWLNRMAGISGPSYYKDWRVPIAEEFVAIRKSFLSNLGKARDLAAAWPFEHKLKSDDEALHKLGSLAIHTSYHIGQIKLIARGIEMLEKVSLSEKDE